MQIAAAAILAFLAGFVIGLGLGYGIGIHEEDE